MRAPNVDIFMKRNYLYLGALHVIHSKPDVLGLWLSMMSLQSPCTLRDMMNIMSICRTAK